MTLGLIMCLWKRPRLARLVMRYWDALEVADVRLCPVAIWSPQDESGVQHEIPESWCQVRAPNVLSAKLNDGVDAARWLCGDLDGVIIMDSDDVATAGTIGRLARELETAQYVVPQSIYAYDAMTGRMQRCRFSRVGAGRALRRDLLGKVDWRPAVEGYENKDAALDKKLHRIVNPRLVSDTLDLVDIKTGENMWSYEWLTAKRPHGRGGVEAIDAADYLREHFPTIAEELLSWTTRQAV